MMVVVLSLCLEGGRSSSLLQGHFDSLSVSKFTFNFPEELFFSEVFSEGLHVKVFIIIGIIIIVRLLIRLLCTSRGVELRAS